MQALVSNIVVLVLVCTGIAIMIGKIAPDEVVKRLLGIAVVVLVAFCVIAVLNNMVVPALIPALDTATKLLIKLMLVVIGLVLLGVVVTVLVRHYMRMSYNRH
ncbi:MAG: hypothetical protein ACR2IF_07170 [Terriglobales bacterium]